MSRMTASMLLGLLLILPCIVNCQYRNIPGKQKYITTSTSYLWGVNTAEQIFKCDRPCTGSWKHIGGHLSQIDTGDMEVWGVNRYGNIWKRSIDGSGDWVRILGNCMITCSINNKAYPINRYSVENSMLLNDIVCNIPFNSNREGRFCGRAGKCSDYGYKNWIKYFTIALLLFYFLVVILRINATSSRLTGIVFVVQCVVSTPLLAVLDDVYAAGIIVVVLCSI